MESRKIIVVLRFTANNPLMIEIQEYNRLTAVHEIMMTKHLLTGRGNEVPRVIITAKFITLVISSYVHCYVIFVIEFAH